MSDKKQSITKLHHLKQKEFLEFVDDVQPYIEDGFLNLSEVYATEKLDGVAIKFGYDVNKRSVFLSLIHI